MTKTYNSFLDVLNAPPEQPIVQPPALCAGDPNPQQTWFASVNGTAPMFQGLSDTRRSAQQWLSQTFHGVKLDQPHAVNKLPHVVEARREAEMLQQRLEAERRKAIG